jgi:hypothetical protein
MGGGFHLHYDNLAILGSPTYGAVNLLQKSELALKKPDLSW